MVRRIVAANGAAAQNAILHTIPQAMGKVCDDTAMQIEATAKQVLDDAATVAKKLNELATAVREHGRLATEHVTQFCARTKNTMDTVARLQDNLINGGDDESTTIESTVGLPHAPQLPDIE